MLTQVHARELADGARTPGPEAQGATFPVTQSRPTRFRRVTNPGKDRTRREEYAASSLEVHRLVHVRVLVIGGRKEGLLDRPRARPAEKVQIRPGLVVGARAAGPAEGLAANDGTGRLVVDVEVAGGKAKRMVCLVDALRAVANTDPVSAYALVLSISSRTPG